MDINCIICSDIFTQNADMVMNQCGHVFHYACLTQWMERSKTCPQCRTRASDKSIYKVYFNYINTDHITDNVGTLQAKLDNANYRIKCHEKDLKKITELSDEREANNIQLRELVAEAESKQRSLESTMLNMRSKLSKYRDQASETDRLKNEVRELKKQLNDLETVKTVVNGTRNELNEILRNETNIEAVGLLAATLKKTLLDAERKYSVVQNHLKHTQNEVMRYKKKCNTLESTCADLRRELETGRKGWDEEKEYLRNKITELSNMSRTADTSVQRIMTESPAPLPRRRADIKEFKSPTVAENVNDLLDSDSPYLSVKSNYTPMLDAHYSMKIGKKKSIFKTKSDAIEQKIPNEKTVYTGLGGQVREDFLKFPTKQPKLGLKRPKSSSSVPSNKFRKLAPINTPKLTDFINF